MELVDVTLDEIARRSRVLLVRHNSTALTRGLSIEQEVVLRDAEGDFFAGRVEDVDFEIDDTVYRISVGVRLPEDLALNRLERLTVGDDEGAEVGPLDMDRLVMLLGDARRARADRSIPSAAALAALRTLRHNVADL
jgi:hypothetical protein